MTCRCPPGSPFHWNEPTFVPVLDWAKVSEGKKKSDDATDAVERNRASGHDYSARMFTRAEPSNFNTAISAKGKRNE